MTRLLASLGGIGAKANDDETRKRKALLVRCGPGLLRRRGIGALHYLFGRRHSGYRCRRNPLGPKAQMEPSVVADDLNEVSVLVSVAHRLLLAVRDDVEASPALQSAVDDLNIAHDQIDVLLDRIAQVIDRIDAATEHGPREQRPAIH